MNKTIVYIIALLLLTTSTFALVEIQDVRAYVDDERESNVDEDGGDIYVYPKDVLDLIIEMNNPDNITVEVEFKATLENIDNEDDIVKEQNWFEVDEEDERSKMISFTIPDDAKEDHYDLVLKIYYKYDNGSEGDWEIDYEVNVRTDGDDTIELEDSFRNLTDTCNMMVKEMSTCYGFINQTSIDAGTLSTCKEERGRFETDYTNCNNNLQTCNAEKTNCEREKQQKINEMGSMVSLSICQNQTSTAVRKAEKSKDQIMIGAGALAVGFYMYMRKKQKNINLGGTYDDYIKK